MKPRPVSRPKNSPSRRCATYKTLFFLKWGICGFGITFEFCFQYAVLFLLHRFFILAVTEIRITFVK